LKLKAEFEPMKLLREKRFFSRLVVTIALLAGLGGALATSPPDITVYQSPT
jgi:hypothetical protein